MPEDSEDRTPSVSPENSRRENLDGVVAEIYDELHGLAKRYFRHQRPGDTLQTTALVHEAYLRLSSSEGLRWQDRNHFYRLAARAMRQILVNHARDRKRLKRGGGRQRVSLDRANPVAIEPSTDLEALDEALERLGAYDRRKCRVVDLRYFGGFSVDETAEILGVSPATVMRDWTLARAWLKGDIGGRSDAP